MEISHAIALTGAIALFGYLGAYVVYNLYLSPLAKIPGHKLAALSRWYEWYWDCIQPGRYSFEMEEMHKTLGPIIRIGPNEVHINDPEWFDTLYASSARLDKDPWFYGFMGKEQSAFTVPSYEIHRMKRSKVNHFFSKANVDRSEPLLQRVLGNMLSNFEAKMNSGQPVALKYAFKSYAADVVCDFCFPSSMAYVKAADFSKSFHDGQEGFAHMIPWFRHFPAFADLIMGTPKWMVPYFPKETQDAMGFFTFIEAQVQEVVLGKDKTSSGKITKPTIVREILDSDLPAADRTPYAVESEAKAFVAAGIATVSRTLEFNFYHILKRPSVVAKLTAEVRNAQSDRTDGLLSLRQLEQLPYLSAVVQESLRIEPAVPSRFPRINHTSAMEYGGYVLPPGTVIGMSPWDIQLDDRVFENAHDFVPERWLDPASKAKLQRFMVAFGKGSRNCVGQNLAVAEITLVLGNMFRKFDMELYETDEKEVELVQDCFMPLPYPGSKGVRIFLHPAGTVEYKN